MNTKKSGFSLIELLVVIVIMGILATISLGTFGGFFKKARDSNREAVMSNLRNIIMADRVGESRQYDVDHADTPYGSVAEYIATVMDRNDLEFPYTDGTTQTCYFGYFSEDEFFVGFVAEDDNDVKIYGTMTESELAGENATQLTDETFGTCPEFLGGETIVEITGGTSIDNTTTSGN